MEISNGILYIVLCTLLFVFFPEKIFYMTNLLYNDILLSKHIFQILLHI